MTSVFYFFINFNDRRGAKQLGIIADQRCAEKEKLANWWMNSGGAKECYYKDYLMLFTFLFGRKNASGLDFMCDFFVNSNSAWILEFISADRARFFKMVEKLS